MDELVIWFTGNRHQDTPPSVVKATADFLNSKPVKVASAKEVVPFFNGLFNKKNYTLIN